MHDTLNLTPRPPRFAPKLGDIATPMIDAFQAYVRDVTPALIPRPSTVTRW
jgi:ketopantoate hydroxymethyltransferase